MAIRPVMIIDQVPRRQRYVRDHDVSITHLTAPAWHWQATWTGADDGRRLVSDYKLGRLLGPLEELDDGSARRT